MSGRVGPTRKPWMDPALREHFVYRAFDATGRLLYVGCTKNLDRRRKEHALYSEWFPFADHFRLAGPYTYEVARGLESADIASEAPFFNMTLANLRARRVESARFKEIAREVEGELDLGADAWYMHMNQILETARLRHEVEFPVRGPMRAYLAAGGVA